MRIGLIACTLLALPMSVAAQSTGELWEITTQMAGMPAGMMPAQRVCQGDDPERAAAQDKNRQNCKVTDRKQTASRLTMTMVCKDSTMTIDQQYNAGRTEFKSTMKMTGRKVGTCDAVAARKERDEKIDAAKKQAVAGQAQAAAMQKQAAEDQIKNCNAALEGMQFYKFGGHGQCYRKTADKQCQQVAQAYPEAAKTCGVRMSEFCKRYQTQEGFLRAKADENAAQMCGVTAASVKTTQCPRAAQSESLGFLGAYCPAEAKPIAQEHCTGRDYTSKMGGKYAAFCQNYLANKDFEEDGRQGGAQTSAPVQRGAPAQKGTPAPASTGKAADPVQEGIDQGLNKLKGLFGR